MDESSKEPAPLNGGADIQQQHTLPQIDILDHPTVSENSPMPQSLPSNTSLVEPGDDPTTRTKDELTPSDEIGTDGKNDTNASNSIGQTSKPQGRARSKSVSTRKDFADGVPMMRPRGTSDSAVLDAPTQNIYADAKSKDSRTSSSAESSIGIGHANSGDFPLTNLVSVVTAVQPSENNDIEGASKEQPTLSSDDIRATCAAPIEDQVIGSVRTDVDREGNEDKTKILHGNFPLQDVEGETCEKGPGREHAESTNGQEEKDLHDSTASNVLHMEAKETDRSDALKDRTAGEVLRDSDVHGESADSTATDGQKPADDRSHAILESTTFTGNSTSDQMIDDTFAGPAPQKSIGRSVSDGGRRVKSAIKPARRPSSEISPDMKVSAATFDPLPAQTVPASDTADEQKSGGGTLIHQLDIISHGETVSGEQAQVSTETSRPSFMDKQSDSGSEKRASVTGNRPRVSFAESVVSSSEEHLGSSTESLADAPTPTNAHVSNVNIDAVSEPSASSVSGAESIELPASKKDGISDKGANNEGAAAKAKPNPTELAPGTSLRAIKSHEPSDEGELQLELGDVIELDITPASDEEYWWYGTNRSWGSNNGQQGFFPAECVEVEKWETPLDQPHIAGTDTSHAMDQTDGAGIEAPRYYDAPPGNAEAETASFEDEWIVPKSVPPGTKVIVKHTYERAKADEIDLTLGDIIVVIEAPEGGWWRGMKNLGGKEAQSGWFPATMVTEEITQPRPRLREQVTSTAATSVPLNDAPKRMSWYKRLTVKKPSSGGTQSSKKNRSRSLSAPTRSNVSLNDCGSTMSLANRSADALALEAVMEGSGDLHIMHSLDDSENALVVTPGDNHHRRSRSAPPVSIVDPSLAEIAPFLSIESSFYERPNLSQSPPQRESMFGPPPLLVEDSQMHLRSGLWQERVSENILQQMTPKERQRMTAIFELIATERDYVRDLKIIVGIFMRPMTERKVVSAKVSEALFSNIEQILLVSQDFLLSLENLYAANPVISRIGDTLLNMMDRFVIYTPYCSQHSTSVTKQLSLMQTKREFRSFLEEAYRNPVTRQLDLGGFLIKPVQRICKYPLLIKEILKYTDETSPDHPLLKEASERIQGIITIVNEGTRQAEGARKLVDIQNNFADKIVLVTPTRHLVREDAVFVTYGDVKKPRRLLLFNDLLLFARKDWRDKYHLVDQAPLRECSIADVHGTSFLELEFLPSEPLRPVADRYLFTMSSIHVKQSWLEAYRSLTPAGVVINSKQLPEAGAIQSTMEIVDDEEDMPARQTSKRVVELQTRVEEERKKTDEAEKALERAKTKVEELAEKVDILTKKAVEAEDRFSELSQKLSSTEQAQKEAHAKAVEQEATLQGAYQQIAGLKAEANELTTQKENANQRVTELTAEVVKLNEMISQLRSEMQHVETGRIEFEKEKYEEIGRLLEEEKKKASFSIQAVQAEKNDVEMKLEDAERHIEQMKKTVADRNDLQVSVSQLQGELEDVQETLKEKEMQVALGEDRIRQVESQLEEARSNAKEKEEEIASFAAERQRYSEELLRAHELAEKSRDECIKLASNLQKATEEYAQMLSIKENELTGISHKLSEETEKSLSLQHEIQRLRFESANYQKMAEEAADRLKDELAQVKAERTREHQQYQELERANREATRQLETGRAQHQQLTDSNRRLAEDSARLKSALNGQGQQLTQLTQEKQNLQGQLNDVKDRASKQATELDALRMSNQQTRDNVQKLQEEAHRATLRAESQTNELGRIRASLDRATAENDELKDKLRKKTAELETLQSRESVEARNRTEQLDRLDREAKSVRERLEKENEGLKEKAKAASTLKKHVKYLEAENQELREKVHELSVAWDTLEGRYRNTENEVVTLRNKLAEAEKTSAAVRTQTGAELELKSSTLREEANKAKDDLKGLKQEMRKAQILATRRERELASLHLVMAEITKFLSLPSTTISPFIGSPRIFSHTLEESISEEVPSPNTSFDQYPTWDNTRSIGILSRVHDLYSENERLRTELDRERSKEREAQELKNLAEQERDATAAALKRIEAKLKERASAHRENLQEVVKSHETVTKETQVLRRQKAALERIIEKQKGALAAIEKEKSQLESQFVSLFERAQSSQETYREDTNRLHSENKELARELETLKAARDDAIRKREAAEEMLKEAENDRIHLQQWAEALRDAKQTTQALLEAANSTGRQLAEELARCREELEDCQLELEESRGANSHQRSRGDTLITTRRQESATTSTHDSPRRSVGISRGKSYEYGPEIVDKAELRHSISTLPQRKPSQLEQMAIQQAELQASLNALKAKMGIPDSPHMRSSISVAPALDSPSATSRPTTPSVSVRSKKAQIRATIATCERLLSTVADAHNRESLPSPSATGLDSSSSSLQELISTTRQDAATMAMREIRAGLNRAKVMVDDLGDVEDKGGADHTVKSTINSNASITENRPRSAHGTSAPISLRSLMEDEQGSKKPDAVKRTDRPYSPRPQSPTRDRLSASMADFGKKGFQGRWSANLDRLGDNRRVASSSPLVNRRSTGRRLSMPTVM